MAKIHYTERLDEILDDLFNENLSNEEFEKLSKKAKIVTDIAKVKVAHDSNRINAFTFMAEQGYIRQGGTTDEIVRSLISNE